MASTTMTQDLNTQLGQAAENHKRICAQAKELQSRLAQFPDLDAPRKDLLKRLAAGEDVHSSLDQLERSRREKEAIHALLEETSTEAKNCERTLQEATKATDRARREQRFKELLQKAKDARARLEKSHEEGSLSLGELVTVVDELRQTANQIGGYGHPQLVSQIDEIRVGVETQRLTETLRTRYQQIREGYGWNQQVVVLPFKKRQ